MTTKIYTLTDPDTNQVRYVGKSNNPVKRYYRHYCYNETKTHKNHWINKLIRENKKPILHVIDEVPITEWVFWETYWINQFKVWGFDLVNTTYGGEGSTLGNKTSFKKGHKLGVGRKLSTATKEKIKLIRTGTKASENTKTKMSSAQKKILRDGLNLAKTGKKTRFKKNEIPWNKGQGGYKLGGERKATPVQQFNLDGFFVCEFISYSEASEITKVSDEGIRKCCNGKAMTAGGFYWKWK